MRVYDNGSSFVVSMNAGEIASFRSRWPCSGLQNLHRVSFEFERDQKQLLGVRCNGKAPTPAHMDGPALVALSNDAERAGRKGAGREGAVALRGAGERLHDPALPLDRPL